MTQRCLRITAAALALAAVLALATPTHAAGPAARTPGLGWIEEVVQWIARVWVGTGQDRGVKTGIGIDPNGKPSPPSGFGTVIDPNGAALDTGTGIDPKG